MCMWECARVRAGICVCSKVYTFMPWSVCLRVCVCVLWVQQAQAQSASSLCTAPNKHLQSNPPYLSLCLFFLFYSLSTHTSPILLSHNPLLSWPSSFSAHVRVTKWNLCLKFKQMAAWLGLIIYKSYPDSRLSPSAQCVTTVRKVEQFEMFSASLTPLGNKGTK